MLEQGKLLKHKSKKIMNLKDRSVWRLERSELKHHEPKCHEGLGHQRIGWRGDADVALVVAKLCWLTWSVQTGVRLPPELAVDEPLF